MSAPHLSPRRASRPTIPFRLAAALLALAPAPGLAQTDRPTRQGAAREMLRTELTGPSGYFRQLTFSPDGKLVAAGLMMDSTVHLFDLAAGKEKLRLQFPGKNYDYHLKFAADGRTLVSEAREDGMLRVWDTVTGRQLREVKKPGRTFLAFAPGGRVAAFTDRGFSAGVDLFAVKTGTRLRTLKGLNQAAGCAFAPDGKLLAVHGHSGDVSLWDVEKGAKVRQLTEGPRHGGAAFALAAFSPDGKLLATGGHIDKFLRVWDVATGKERLRLPCQGFFVSAAFSPDGTLLAHGSTDGLGLYDLLNGKELWRLGHPVRGQFVAFSPDGALLAVAGQTADRVASITFYEMPTRRKEPLPKALDAAQLEALWQDLPTADDFRLQRMLGSLRAAPADAVPFLGKKVRPVAEERLRRVKGLLKDLDDDDPPKRERATKELQAVAAAFEPLLTQARRDAEPGEVRNRVQIVLQRMREAQVPQTLLAELRAVGVLEQIATPAAREVLAALAGGAPGARLTAEARQALERLRQPRPKR
jgi:roadblock/LC7 domain-containing protein